MSETAGLISFFPRKHMLLAGALAAALVVTTTLPVEQHETRRQTHTLALPQMENNLLETVAVVDTSWLDLTPEEPTNKPFETTVKSGDTLSTLFQDAGLTDADMYALVNSSKEAKGLTKLYPGHQLVFAFTESGQLQSLTHHIDILNSQIFTATPTGFEYSKIEKQPEIKIAVRTGTIDSSLYKAGLAAGLDEELIMGLAGIFGWDVDFALDIRRGDSFRILYEEKFLDGKRLGAGNILAAEFVNQDTRFQAVRYVDTYGDVQYYSPSGKAMRKAFLRAPLDFRRISSNFNPKRLHPILKTVRPHRGTDYAADRGTPVWASGNGKIIASGYTEANGNYVVIQHGANIQTKYLHLHKRAVKAGGRIKQGQVIGTVGSTGYSTAPHLHYEFLVDGVHRDPRTILEKLPKAESIPNGEMQRFVMQTQPLIAQLGDTTTFASNSSNPKL